MAVRFRNEPARIPEREPVDVGEVGVVDEPLDGSGEGDMRVPVVLVEDGERDARVASDMAEPGARLVHVQEDEPVDPVVPGGDRVGRAVGSNRPDDGRMRLAQERFDLGWDGRRQEEFASSLRVLPRARVPVAPQTGVGLPERHCAVIVVRLLGREVAARGSDELLLRYAGLDAARPRVEPLA